ncbi:MAG: cytochrome c, partial [Gemmatimonadaceae bacterium]
RVAALALALIAVSGTAHSQLGAPPMSGRQLFVAACASCHGHDGRGASRAQVGFAEDIPDLTECVATTRETEKDWSAVVHGGGRVRGFSHRMPAFGSALTAEEILRVVKYLRSLCGERSWPRGELNLPRPMATEKAFPEDETVVTASAITKRGERVIGGAIAYERRIGIRNQWELEIPFGVQERPTDGGWSGGQLGDMVVAFKRVLLAREGSGTIISLMNEVALPTGDSRHGIGSGMTIFESSIAAAQTLPFESFLQVQGGVELPANRRKGEHEGFASAVFGTTIAPGMGRAWTPMMELTASRSIDRHEKPVLDLIPQMQVTLSRRQHIKASIGMRLPVTERTTRTRELLAYVIWDWFDGGLFDGW